MTGFPFAAAATIPVVTAAMMAEVDRRAVEDYGISPLQMMELAGSQLTEIVRRESGGDLRGRRIVVAVGPGNNGGGGLAAARHLANRGADTRVVLARPALRMTEAGRHQLATLLAIGTSCVVATYDLPPDDLDGLLSSADLVIDAILGYGGHGVPHGDVARLVRSMNRSGRPVVSLDVPSGMDPDTGENRLEVIEATATLTLGLPKPGVVAVAGVGHVGRLYLADIGLPAALYASMGLEVDGIFSAGGIVRNRSCVNSTAASRSLAEKLGLLRELDLFAGLSDADMMAIGHATTMTHCVAGQRILSPDDPPDRIHIVKHGRVRFYRTTPDGRQLTLDLCEKGTVLGDMTLLGQGAVPEAFAEAMDGAIICTITPDELRRLIERYPVIGVNIIRHLSGRLRAAERELESMAYQRVDQRLARRLVDLGQRFGVATPRGTLIRGRLTQQELADMVGTTRETLAHTIGDFRRAKLLDTPQHRIVIRDAERLAAIAGRDR